MPQARASASGLRVALRRDTARHAASAPNSPAPSGSTVKKPTLACPADGWAMLRNPAIPAAVPTTPPRSGQGGRPVLERQRRQGEAERRPADGGQPQRMLGQVREDPGRQRLALL